MPITTESVSEKIDRIVKRLGIKPSSDADTRATLLQSYFDLIGSHRWWSATGRLKDAWVGAGVSLVVFLVGSPFWILGFTLDESASYSGWTHAVQVFALAILGQVVTGGVFYLAHLTIAKNRRHTPVALWLLALIWSASAIARVAFLIVGLSILGPANSKSAPIRITTSTLIATLGFGIGAYGFDALHRFMTDCAGALTELLEAVRRGATGWIRVGMTVEEDAIVFTMQNNGLPHQSKRAGMGTAHLNQLAPHNWTRLTTEQGTTQLLVRLHKDHVGAHAASRG